MTYPQRFGLHLKIAYSRLFNRSILLLSSLLIFVFINGCAGTKSMNPTAEVIFINGSIWTGNPEAPEAEAIAVGDEEILAIGTAASVMSTQGPETKLVDMGGYFVVPGFIDNHTHFISGGYQLASVDLRDARTKEEFIRRIETYVANLPEGRWITGGDWDHERWGGELPHRNWIDSVTPNNPVLISRLDGHMALANSKALDLAKIDELTQDPDGGTIIRDEKSNRPTGILKDKAMSPVYRVIPADTEAELDEALKRGMEHAVSQGVTQFYDMGSWTDLATFQRAAGRGELRARVYSFVPIGTWSRMEQFVKENGRGNDWHRWGGLKGFVDGSLGSTTAWFHDPYEDEPETNGLMVTDTSDLRSWIESGDAVGLHVGVHAIGDCANDWLLDVYAAIAAKNGPRDRRFRIEHAQHLTSAAISRFSQLGVIPAMQPYHCIDDGRWAEKRIGPERIKTTYAFRSLLDSGATLSLGSDWTVAPLSPLEGIYAAVTRRTLDDLNPGGWIPQEKISVEEALHCYTMNNARAGFHEHRTGTLEPGKLADFVVLSQDLLTINPVDIPEVKVLMTIVGGEIQYQSE
jgi:predicted amidohydrolase YtcJ